MSENIGGPGDRWVRKTNARERKNCIIDSGEENKKVAQRMESAIERKNMQGVKGTFSLDVYATKFTQVLEVKHAHRDIIGGEQPQHLIPIDGMDKIEVQDLLDGKLEEYGKVSIARKLKVRVM